MRIKQPFIALFLLLAGVPFAALRGQESPPPAARLLDSAPLFHVSPLASPAEPQKTFFTGRDLAATAVAAGITVGIMQFDKKIAHWTQTPSVQGSSTRHNAVNSLTKINETPLGIASVLTYGVGRLTKSQTTADVGLHWAEALFMTDVISEAIRGPVGRTRPRVTPDDPFKFQFWKGFTNFDNRAFPSLHSAVGFATAAALLGEVRERNPSATWYAAPLLYGFAIIPGTTRMYLNQHWASDVFAGAFIGQLIGSRVVHYAHTHKRTKLDRALLATSVAPDEYGGMRVSVSLGEFMPAGW
jgi:membrane-associated phospholipid phosphatase